MPIPAGKTQCPYCKTLQFKGGGKPGSDMYGDSKALSSVSPAAFQRISTGPWDIVMGCNQDENGKVLDYGPVPSGLILIGGDPGAGKSTIMLQWFYALAEKIAPKNEWTLYLASEEAEGMISARARRLKLPMLENVRIRDMTSGEHTPSSFIDTCRVKPRVVVVDSTKQYLSGLETECKALKKQAIKHGIIMFLIHQVNKDMAFVGEMSIQHVVDTTIAFVCRSDGSNIREMVAVKNRVGATWNPTVWDMTDLGLQFLGLKEELEAGKKGKKKAAPKPVEPEEVLEDLEELDHEKISRGSIPNEADFFRLNPRDTPIEIESDEEGTVDKFSSEEMWEMIQKEHAKPTSDGLLEQLLELSGFIWEEKSV